MKKYLFGVVAIIFAIAAVAFTKPTPRIDYFFQFKAGVTPTKANVENPANWEIAFVQDLTTGCNPSVNEKPCKIKVPESCTEVVGGIRRLKATAGIVASQFSTNCWYVSGGTCVLDKRNVAC